LVIDGHSPDGTGMILDRLVSHNKAIHVFHRPGKLGLGTAHLLAMKFAMHHQFDFLITMDADFSHHPKYLPKLVLWGGESFSLIRGCSLLNWRRHLKCHPETRLAVSEMSNRWMR
jgi:dolichol-phosphate mannosyltransferase